MSELLIRRALPGDEFAIGPVHAQAWREAYAGIISDAWLASISDEERISRWAAILRDPDPTRQWVAIFNGRVVGFAASGPSRRAAPIRDIELKSIYVLATNHRQGVGRALVSEAIGDGPASVWVLRENRPAQDFYRSLGFEFDGATATVDHWEGVPEDRMTR